MRPAAVLMLLTITAAPALAADPPEKLPVVVVNLQKVMFTCVPGKAAVDELQGYADKMQSSINAKQEEAAKVQAELKEKDKTLKDEDKAKLRKRADELEGEARTIQNEAQQKLEKLTDNVAEQLQAEANRLIKEYSKERGIQLVIDQSPARDQRNNPVRQLNALVINPDNDITEEIIKRLATFKIKPPTEDKPDPKDNDPKPQVLLQTTMGDIILELDRAKAPITVANFLKYVDTKHYDGTVFHRVMKDFVVQGGGHVANLDEKPTQKPIKNEASNGLSNVRGTIAMAREPEPDTATSQFYFNVVDNDKKLDHGPMKAGYCVFGKVIKGMDVIDKMREVKVANQKGMENVPVEPITLKSATRVAAPTK